MTTATDLTYGGQVHFSYGGVDVRVVPLDGFPAFVLADVLSVLGIDPARLAHVLSKLIREAAVDTPFGRRRMTVIELSDVLGLVVHADAFRTCVDATAFWRWVRDVPLQTVTGQNGRSAAPVQQGFVFSMSHAAAVALAAGEVPPVDPFPYRIPVDDTGATIEVGQNGNDVIIRVDRHAIFMAWPDARQLVVDLASTVTCNDDTAREIAQLMGAPSDG